MAQHGRPTISKRQKERNREEKRKLKAERKVQREAEKAQRPPGAPGEDPDIAGIVPGPQQNDGEADDDDDDSE